MPRTRAAETIRPSGVDELGGFGGQGEEAHPPHPLVKSRILPVPALAQMEDLTHQGRGRHHEHDHGLDHRCQVDGDTGRRLHVASAGAEGGEQERPEHDAQRAVPAQQGDGDAVETVAAAVAARDEKVRARQRRHPGQADQCA